MTVQTTLWILVALQVKHLLIDWCWQPAYEWKNKGTYGHFGGVRHALKNGAGTAVCLAIGASPLEATLLGGLDALAHYHIDWSKMNLNRRARWGPTTSEYFWWLTGFDQFLHQATYLALVAFIAM